MTIAEVLRTAIMRFGVNSPNEPRRKFLQLNPAKFIGDDGSVHQVMNYNQRAAVWEGVCGAQFTGNGYIEAANARNATCFVCIAEETDGV